MDYENKVKESLGNIPVPEKIEKNQKVSDAVDTHPAITGYPVDHATYDTHIENVSTHYIAHLGGDTVETEKMRKAVKIMDGDYALTAKHIEKEAVTTGNRSLVLEFGFEFYAERSKPDSKGLVITPGIEEGQMVFEYKRLDNAKAYRAEIAELIPGAAPVFKHANSCGITTMAIGGFKPDTEYQIILCGIFSAGEGPFSEPVTFRTPKAKK